MCACKETLYDVSDKLAAHIIQNDDDFRKHNDAQMLAIRLSIKEIYERNIDTKTLSKKERYDLFKLADAYDAFDGNSYIQADVAEMKTWPERNQTA